MSGVAPPKCYLWTAELLGTSADHPRMSTDAPLIPTPLCWSICEWRSCWGHLQIIPGCSQVLSHTPRHLVRVSADDIWGTSRIIPGCPQMPQSSSDPYVGVSADGRITWEAITLDHLGIKIHFLNGNGHQITLTQDM